MIIILLGITFLQSNLVSGFNISKYYNNPGGRGTGQIVKLNSGYIWYKRGKSTLRISVILINQIVDYIDKNIPKGTKVYVKDIINIKNTVNPNYKGWHNCDATFIMMLLKYIRGNNIYGKKPVFIIT